MVTNLNISDLFLQHHSASFFLCLHRFFLFFPQLKPPLLHLLSIATIMKKAAPKSSATGDKSDAAAKATGTDNPNIWRPHNLKRVINEDTRTKLSPSKKKTRLTIPLYTAMAREGIVVAFISRPDNVNVQGFVGRIFTRFRLNEELAQRCHVNMVAPRRKPMSLPGAHYNEPMMASLNPNEGFFFNSFVRLYDNPAHNTIANNATWAAGLVEACNEISREEFEYPTLYEFRADLTVFEEVTDVLPPPNEYLLNRDCMRLLDHSYPLTHYTRETQANNLAHSFFGTDPLARNIILNFDQFNLT
jgi:hypothetical protein